MIPVSSRKIFSSTRERSFFRGGVNLLNPIFYLPLGKFRSWNF